LEKFNSNGPKPTSENSKAPKFGSKTILKPNFRPFNFLLGGALAPAQAEAYGASVTQPASVLGPPVIAAMMHPGVVCAAAAIANFL